MPKIIKDKQAVELLGVSRSTLLVLRKQGKIPYIQISTQRIGYLESDLQAYLNANRISQQQNTAQ